MTELLPIFIFSMILAYLSDRLSDAYIDEWGSKRYSRKDVFFFFIMALSMCVFVGLRRNYNDTYVYLQMYDNLSVEKSISSQVNLSLASSPGFTFVSLLMKKAGCSDQTHLMLFALFDVGVGLWFVRKHTNNITLAVFYFYAIGIYTFYMAAIMQCTALSCCLIAVDRLLSKRKIGFVFWIAVGTLFHTYCALYLLAPLMMKAPWTRVTYITLFAVVLAIVFFRPLLETMVMITTAMGESYTVEEFSQEGVNIFRVAVCIIPTILSFAARRFLIDSKNKEENLLINFAVLNGLLMFMALFGTANYFARMANYFLIFQIFALPLLFRYFNAESKRLLTVMSIVGYSIYFYYANAILYGGFDALFRRVTLWEYLKTLL